MVGILESDRSDDEDMEAPIYVFDDNESGRWIKEEAVFDSGAVKRVARRERVPHLKVDESPESRRGETDVRRRKRNQEGRQSNNPLDKWIRCFEERCVQGWSSVPHAYQCRQVARKKASCDSHKESSAHHYREDR